MYAVTAGRVCEEVGTCCPRISEQKTVATGTTVQLVVTAVRPDGTVGLERSIGYFGLAYYTPDDLVGAVLYIKGGEDFAVGEHRGALRASS